MLATDGLYIAILCLVMGRSIIIFYCVDDTKNCLMWETTSCLCNLLIVVIHTIIFDFLFRKIESKSGLLVPLNEGKLQKMMSTCQVEAQCAVEWFHFM